MTKQIIKCENLLQGKIMLALKYADQVIVNDELINKNGINFETRPATKEQIGNSVSLVEALNRIHGNKK